MKPSIVFLMNKWKPEKIQRHWHCVHLQLCASQIHTSPHTTPMESCCLAICAWSYSALAGSHCVLWFSGGLKSSYNLQDWWDSTTNTKIWVHWPSAYDQDHDQWPSQHKIMGFPLPFFPNMTNHGWAAAKQLWHSRIHTTKFGHPTHIGGIVFH